VRSCTQRHARAGGRKRARRYHRYCIHSIPRVPHDLSAPSGYTCDDFITALDTAFQTADVSTAQPSLTARPGWPSWPGWPVTCRIPEGRATIGIAIGSRETLKVAAESAVNQSSPFVIRGRRCLRVGAISLAGLYCRANPEKNLFRWCDTVGFARTARPGCGCLSTP
jgi:hypothetical protein